MDKTNKVLIYSDDLEDMYGSEQDRLDIYNEMLRCNNEEPLTEYCKEVDNYHYMVLADDYNIFKDEFGNLAVLAIADLGLWYGRRDGGKTGFLEDLLPKMCEDFNEIWYNREDGTIEIIASHHDGCNYFKIYALSEEGKQYLEENGMDYTDRELHEYLVANKETMLKRIEY